MTSSAWANFDWSKLDWSKLDWSRLGGNPEMENEFMLHLGKCVSYWSKIEQELYTICRWLLCSDTRAAIIYYRTPTVSARIELTTKLVGTIFQAEGDQHVSPEMKQWGKIEKELKSDLKVRNQLAHAPVSAVLERSGDKPNEWILRYQNSISWMEEKHKKSGGRAIVLEDLHDHLGRLSQHQYALKEFRTNVLGPKLDSLPPPQWRIKRKPRTRNYRSVRRPRSSRSAQVKT